MTTILDGKALAAKTDENTKIEIQDLADRGIIPGLVVILVGHDEASQLYVRNKDKRARKMGIHSVVRNLPETITEEELIQIIHSYNADPTINAILVQLPLPAHINEFHVTTAIAPQKDADGFHPVNLGKLIVNRTEQTPIACTPAGIMEFFKAYHISLDGKKAVVVGRSTIVGKPMAALLVNANATVTVAHSHTKKLSELTQEADILVVAVGVAHFIKAGDVKNGAVVIDVGMDRDAQHKLVGDVDFDEVKNKAAYITPVPRGVGPMTISMLMAQTVSLTKWSSEQNG
ncbi:bifunctional methylenetetrahydrofolate dehydrogenase/methenyltetrahydrofolate cyclohydrolase FolD [Pediococcus inopinatus]|uniref:bifunctional methylenetetrahydrofolate dehydrogenase/methenyltetrahydrofolate cyclohydrolase FolD n=1 Tax=Pediococcus inopinatus TaxID=114090 RepID=UPI002B25D66B|nr:bifunctional methylenetetrahydrofolate dehydrogenase/methenyltetrahydrofolate cyclohydrolase FolD [Pediococcus inopinatus]WPC17529.1 bifunctional methylenetetrahydrofolate dehydrogenase/methenyltetrahydrofolate cyclohydrolase FolD [Pediococcus inopinatus]